MTLTIARKQPPQPIERGVWGVARDYSQCDSCGGMIVKWDAVLRFPRNHGALCIDCAAPLKRGERL